MCLSHEISFLALQPNQSIENKDHNKGLYYQKELSYAVAADHACCIAAIAEEITTELAT